jgi:hypothetical protein
MKSFCEPGKEFSGFHKRRAFLGKLNEYHLIKKNAASSGCGSSTDAQHL